MNSCTRTSALYRSSGPSTDTKVPNAFEHVVRIDPRSSANGLERCREEGVTYRNEAVDEVDMQSVGPGAVSLQCTGEPMLGYQELHEQSHPCPQSRLGRCTLREHLVGPRPHTPRLGVGIRLPPTRDASGSGGRSSPCRRRPSPQSPAPERRLRTPRTLLPPRRAAPARFDVGDRLAWETRRATARPGHQPCALLADSQHMFALRNNAP